MKRLYASAIILACVAFSGCGYSAPDPDSDDATFAVEITNGGSSTTFYIDEGTQGGLQFPHDAMISVAPGGLQVVSPLRGSNGSSFTFYFYQTGITLSDFSQPNPNQLLATGSCTLKNADKSLFFNRVVRFNPGTGEIHCELWD